MQDKAPRKSLHSKFDEERETHADRKVRRARLDRLEKLDERDLLDEDVYMGPDIRKEG